MSGRNSEGCGCASLISTLFLIIVGIAIPPIGIALLILALTGVIAVPIVLAKQHKITKPVMGMTGIEYEHFVAQHYRADGYKNVFVTKGSGDFGADIILYDKQTNTQKFCIQCKKSSSPVGVKAVQEVLGAREYYKCNGALVITTSTFTEAAKEMAGKTGVALVEKFTSSKYFPPPKRKKRKKKNTNKKDNLDWIDQIEEYHAFMDD